MRMRAMFIIAALALVMYLPALRGGILETHGDDAHLIARVEARDLRADGAGKLAGFFAIWNASADATISPYPVMEASLALDQFFFAVRDSKAASGESGAPGWRINPAGFHAISILIHALTGLCFMALLQRAGASSRCVVYAGAFFLFSCAGAQSVAWISARGMQLATLFMLISALALMRAMAAQQQRARIGWLCALIVAALAAALAAPSALCVLLLLIVILIDYRRRAPEAAVARSSVIVVAITCLLLIAIQFAQWQAISSSIAIDRAIRPSLLAEAPALFAAVHSACNPFVASVVTPAPPPPGVVAWTCALALLALIFAPLIWLRHRPLLALAIVWMPLSLLAMRIGANDFALDDAIRPLLIPSLGGALLLAQLIEIASARHARFGAIAFVALAMIAILATITEVQRWRDDVPLWTSVVARAPSAMIKRPLQAYARLGHGLQIEAEAAAMAGDQKRADLLMDRSMIALRDAVAIHDAQMAAGHALDPALGALVARVNLASVLVNRSMREQRLELAQDALKVLAPVIALGGNTRSALIHAMLGVPGYSRARAVLDAIHENWPPLRAAAEDLVRAEESLQISAWMALTSQRLDPWRACLTVLEMDNELAAMREGEPIDPERMAQTSPGWLRLRRALAYMLLDHPEFALEFVAATRHEGDVLPARIERAIAEALAQADAGNIEAAELQLLRSWTAAPGFSRSNREVESFYRKHGSDVQGARFAKLARALEEEGR